MADLAKGNKRRNDDHAALCRGELGGGGYLSHSHEEGRHDSSKRCAAGLF